MVNKMHDIQVHGSYNHLYQVSTASQIWKWLAIHAHLHQHASSRKCIYIFMHITGQTGVLSLSFAHMYVHCCSHSMVIWSCGEIQYSVCVGRAYVLYLWHWQGPAACVSVPVWWLMLAVCPLPGAVCHLASLSWFVKIQFRLQFIKQ